MKNKNDKFILQPGKVCTFDVNNVFKKDDIESIIFVEIVEEIPKKTLFGPRWFKIIGTGDDANKLTELVEVPETLLKPSGMVVIRYPSNFPVINNKDIKALDDAIKLLNYSILSENHRNITLPRLKALKEKLEFSMKSMEV